MDPWAGWPFARGYLLLVSAAFVVFGSQVFLFHWRGAFRAKSMYGPVLLSPFITASGVAASIAREGLVGWIALGIFGLGFVDGLIGLGFHLRGVAARIGGFTLRNILAGPPFLLPLVFSALALSGALAIVWSTF